LFLQELVLPTCSTVVVWVGVRCSTAALVAVTVRDHLALLLGVMVKPAAAALMQRVMVLQMMTTQMMGMR
jgi:hypothetical protein